MIRHGGFLHATYATDLAKLMVQTIHVMNVAQLTNIHTSMFLYVDMLVI